MAVAACDDLHMRVGRDRFPVCDFSSGASRSVPGQRGLEVYNSNQRERTRWCDGIIGPTKVIL
jgi:hypothetical protein